MAPIHELGFSALPEHLNRRSAKKGFEFTLMVVGETGLGKSTLMSCLFGSDLGKSRKTVPPPLLTLDTIKKTLTVEKQQLDIVEKSLKLRVTIIDTPGYGEGLNTESGLAAIESYIKSQYEEYFREESGINRKSLIDNRVHCCLYFISPMGRGLTQLDVLFMKRLQHKVNIVPVIGKADTLTESELNALKKKILKDVSEHEIEIFQIPECDSDEEDFKKKDRELKAAMPFAVVGSSTVLEVLGRKIRGREYPWGIVDICDDKVSDFNRLKTFISLHMQDLKDHTNDVLYETFRTEHLSSLRRESGQSGVAGALRSRHDSGADLLDSIDGSSMPDDAVVEALQKKDEEIRRMQQQLLAMQAQLKITSRSAPVSAAHSQESLQPPTRPYREEQV